MTAEAVIAAPERSLPPIRRKLLALAVFALAAALLYYIDKLPSALKVDDHPSWKAGRNDGLILYGLPERQVLEFSGAPGAGLTLRAAAVRPAPAMLNAIEQAGLRRPEAGPAPLTWLGLTGPSGKIGFKVANGRGAPDAGLALHATGTADIPQLRLTPVDTTLTVTLHAAAGEDDAVPPIGLRLGDAQLPQPLATMLPVTFELPAGRSILLTFPSAAAMNGASFRLGMPASDDELASNLAVTRFEIGRRRDGPAGAALGPVEDGVCGATAGTFLFRRLTPRPSDCGEGGDLAVERLEITPEAVAIDASGSGFVTQDGAVVAAGLLTSIWNNKLVAALLTIALGTLATWVWKTTTGLGKP